VMYFLRLDDPVFLDDADLTALAARHKLRMTFMPLLKTRVPVEQAARIIRESARSSPERN